MLLAWQVLGDSSSPYFPPPATWVDAVADRIQAGELLPAMVQTLASVSLGLAVATTLGVTLGVALGMSQALARYLGSTLEFLRTLPPPAVVPVAALIVGVNGPMKVFVIVFAAFWPIVLGTFAAVEALHPLLWDVSRSLHLTKREKLIKVTIPALLPAILTAIRVAAPLAIIISLLTEMLTSMPGLGATLLLAQRNFNAAEVFGLLVVVGFFGLALNGFLALAESSLVRPGYPQSNASMRDRSQAA
nr:ABC transporter permease subunit [Mesorhizobium camelthorni]